MQVLDAIAGEVQKLRSTGMTYAAIDHKLGFPKTSQGRASWFLNQVQKVPTPGNGAAGDAETPVAAPVVAPVVVPTPAVIMPALARAHRYCPECGRRHNNKRK